MATFKKILSENNVIVFLNGAKKLFEKIKYIQSENDIDHERVCIDINGCILINDIETHHFFIQLFRIPLSCGYEASLVKFGQIAYNVGQLLSTLEAESYAFNVLAFIQNNNLTEMATFIGSI